MASVHPYTRYVAVGDSFTEGVGDPDLENPGALRGWADRVAEELARTSPGFLYANLAVRGKLVQQICADQIDAALALKPDLISISAGGNDSIRPGTNPDEFVTLVDRAVERLRSDGATVVLFTGMDVEWSRVFRPIRGKVAIYNEHLRGIAYRHGAVVADQWSLKSIQEQRMWSEDRLHLAPAGHQEIARLFLDSLGVPHQLAPGIPEPERHLDRLAQLDEDAHWVRHYALPWVGRRIRHVSSGDGRPPKRPALTPVN